MVVSKQAWATRAGVCPQLKSFQLAGFAVVRHGTPRKRWGYATGLEFRGPLKRHETGTWKIRRIRHADGVWTKSDAQVPIDELSQMA
ncbi:MAG: hypothetical protein ACLQU1_18365 [Bryobacteraceae bacterium]